MEFAGALALLIVGAAIVLVVKGWDVRLVLLAAALVIAATGEVTAITELGGTPGAVEGVLRVFLATFSNEKFVVPICTAMGFAHVLKHTGCERHLILLLVRPLRRVRGLLVPGVVAVGFLVNIPLVSQTSTAVCLGAVVVPLMRASGYSMATIGACLLLGASVGGELLNPGAPELLTVADRTNVATIVQTQRYLPPLVFTQLAVATAVIWLMSVWWERKEPTPPASREEPTTSSPLASGEGEPPAGSPCNPLLSGKGETEPNPECSARFSVLSPSPFRGGVGEGLETEPNPLTPFPKKEGGEHSKAQAIAPQAPVLSPSPFGGGVGEGLPTQPEPINLLKALVPLVPLALLFASAMPAPYNLFEIPDSWVVLKKPDGSRDPAYNSRLIGFAMLIGVLVAAAVTPNKARDCVKEFFSGAGYGFANIVSLIVIANCFGEAIKSAGLAEALGALIRSAPGLMQPLAALVPLVFAAICGSGMASTQSLYGFFHGPAEALGLDPVAVGAMVSLGSAAGRTMSPVAAVVLMCGTLTGTNPFTLAKRVAVPLLVGITVVVLLRLAGAL